MISRTRRLVSPLLLLLLSFFVLLRFPLALPGNGPAMQAGSHDSPGSIIVSRKQLLPQPPTLVLIQTLVSPLQVPLGVSPQITWSVSSSSLLSPGPQGSLSFPPLLFGHQPLPPSLWPVVPQGQVGGSWGMEASSISVCQHTATDLPLVELQGSSPFQPPESPSNPIPILYRRPSAAIERAPYPPEQMER